MEQQQLMALVSKTAALMESFERRCNQIEQRQLALTEQLQQLAQQVPAAVRQSADSSLQSLPGQLLGKVQHGLEQPVSAYEKRLQNAGSALQEGSQSLALQMQRMEGLHRHLVWKTVGATTTCMLLLLVGGIWLSTHYYGVIRENQIAADLLEAYNRADVTLCGEGRLCAKVDVQEGRNDHRSQYVRIKQR
jgi:prefoldin subunit 5